MSTRAAVITDIHGNVPALEAALCRIGELSVDDVYCGGDLVGYGPPRTRSAARSRSGAYRRSTATTTSRSRAISTTAAAYPTPKDREIGQGSVAWTLVHTDERSKRFMRDLVGFANSDGVVFVDESAEKIATTWVTKRI